MLKGHIRSMSDFIECILFSYEMATEEYVTQELTPYDRVYANP
jgi:hypothetical protein